jgi:hypothetical protein
MFALGFISAALIVGVLWYFFGRNKPKTGESQDKPSWFSKFSGWGKHAHEDDGQAEPSPKKKFWQRWGDKAANAWENIKPYMHRPQRDSSRGAPDQPPEAPPLPQQMPPDNQYQYNQPQYQLNHLLFNTYPYHHPYQPIAYRSGLLNE